METASEGETMATTTLKVSGMTCGHCVRAVQQALEGTAGVQAAQVDLQGGRAVVEYDEATVSPPELAKAVSEEGYLAEESP
jgi:copper chaperone